MLAFTAMLAYFNMGSSCISREVAVQRALAGAQGQYAEAVCHSHSAPGYDPYRCDCSGLVSYAWAYPPPGFTTQVMQGNQCAKLGSMSELQPADAILHPFGDATYSAHVEFFVRWASDDEQAVLNSTGRGAILAGCHNTAEGCSHRAVDIDYYTSRSFFGCRPHTNLVCSASEAIDVNATWPPTCSDCNLGCPNCQCGHNTPGCACCSSPGGVPRPEGCCHPPQ